MQAEDPLPLSALQHLLYCPRQCALIHLEMVWSENLYTAEGRVLHQNVHGGGSESRKNIRAATGLRLLSNSLGLFGQADLVEFHRVEKERDEQGRKIAVALDRAKGWWKPYPVEYKRGRPKKHQADLVQLCAQAVCLEEMLKVYISSGALFYGATRRRQEVMFTEALRELTKNTAARLHQLMADGKTPLPRYENGKCDKCSLLDACRPHPAGRQSVASYIKRMISQSNEKAA